MFLNHFSRRGNALLLTTIILALVVTGMLSLTDQLLGRKQLADLSRVTIRAQETADNVAEAICDRIKTNASLLTVDFVSSETSGTTGSDGAILNKLDNWLARGFVKNSSDVASTKGIWLNNCVVYWRLEPVTAFDHTMTDTTGDGVIDKTDIYTNNGVNYMTNRSLDIADSATTPDHSNAPSGSKRLENSGLLFFEMTIDAFAMSAQHGMNANPLDAATNASSAHSGDRSPFHAQIKKRVMVKNVSLFRYVIFYNAVGKAGDFELYGSPDVTVVGAVHTNGAAYIGAAGGGSNSTYKVIFGSNPVPEAEPTLRSVPVTAVDGLFCMQKRAMYEAGELNPMAVARGTSAGNDYQGSFAYINAAKLKFKYYTKDFTETTKESSTVSFKMPAFDTITVDVAAKTGPFTMARDSRPVSEQGSPLNGYDGLIRDGPNRKLKTIDITQKLNMNGYRPLEPFSLVGPDVPLQLVGGKYSIAPAATGSYATDMMLFKAGNSVGISEKQAAGTADLPTGNSLKVRAFDPISNPIAGLVPPPISRATTFTIDNTDIFSHLGTYIIPPVPNGSPVLGTYIRNPLGLNATKDSGVGIVILERGRQAGINTWPSGRRGKVSWDPPCQFSTDDPNNSGNVLWRYYDSNQDGIIDPDLDTNGDSVIDGKDDKNVDLDEQGHAIRDGNPNGQMTAFLMDYCQWMRSNYVVYFGVNSAGTALIDITDQFFSVPTGAIGLESLLAQEDVFKDRREATWRESSANGYAKTRPPKQPNESQKNGADFDNIRVNALTLNIAAINNFISTTQLNRLDPAASASTDKASTRFNGTIYAARTPRYSALPVAATTPTLGVSQNDFDTKMFTYRAPGFYDPIAPLGFNQTWASVNGNRQDTTLPIAARDGLTLDIGGALLYPVVGSTAAATVNGYPKHANVAFGSRDSWSCYPMLKRVRVRNAGTIDWGRTRKGRKSGLTIYTPNVCYLQGNFNVTEETPGSGKFPACALYCDGLVALSENWSDVVANDVPSGAQFSGVAKATIHRLCLVIHNNPTDLGNIATPNNDVAQPGGSGGVHNVIKFLENWTDVNWAFIGSLVVLDRARYTRGYLGNQDVYNPPKRFYNFNEDLKIELPPFPDVINEVFVW